MTTHYAKAYPRKRFFLEMFTRDISLDDCILDLIDNSIDAMIRSKKLDISNLLLDAREPLKPTELENLPSVKLDLSMAQFSIKDNCGGISREDAENDVFNFGHAAGYDSVDTGRKLGAYGIGLKRAIFKIGNRFEMRSKTKTEGFTVDIDIGKWSQKDKDISDWRFPIDFIDGASSAKAAGTHISIKELGDEVKMALENGMLESRLYKAIAQTYAAFLNKEIVVYLNGNIVEPLVIPLGQSDDVSMAREDFIYDSVQVKLIASLATKGGSKGWQAETAGWYVLCNGRLIVSANKTELTGWGAEILPNFHPKFRGFIGLVLFNSDDPLKLPWTTTKRGLNRDSAVYQVSRNKMGDVGRPIIKFLDSLYDPKDEQSPDERMLAQTMKPAQLGAAISTTAAAFAVRTRRRSAEKSTVRIQFEANKTQVQKIRKHLGASTMSGAEIGEHVFNYFLDNEGL